MQRAESNARTRMANVCEDRSLTLVRLGNLDDLSNFVQQLPPTPYVAAMSEQEEEGNDGAEATLIKAGAAVVLAWLGFYAAGLWLWGTMEPNEIEDAFNILTSLFTGLALAAVAVSIHFQREDLKSARKDMRESRSLLVVQVEAQDRQATTDALSSLASILTSQVDVVEAWVSDEAVDDEDLRSRSAHLWSELEVLQEEMASLVTIKDFASRVAQKRLHLDDVYKVSRMKRKERDRERQEEAQRDKERRRVANDAGGTNDPPES